jgi:hypothetical protein
MKRTITCLIVLLVGLISGCRHTGPSFMPEKNATVLTAEAGVFMVLLHGSDALPGLGKTRKGEFQSGIMCDSSPQPGFPFNANLRAVMKDEPGVIYYFVVTKPHPGARWSVTNAWKDGNGARETLPLPALEAQAAANAELLNRKARDAATNKKAASPR